MSGRLWWLALLVVLALAPRPAAADNACRVVDVSFTPTDGLQIVGWVEKPDGTFVDTIYITQKTGRFGLGNRPGRFDFNSGPVPAAGKDDLWPYGRRITTFPVWAHRHGKTFPQVVFQNGDENNLSHPFSDSSREATPPYCRPEMPGEKAWDTATCATASFTDKGKFSLTDTSLYPPRADVMQSSTDSPSVAMYKMMNPFDVISQATPKGGQCAQITWPIPSALPVGDYVMWLEVGKEFDFNSAYNCSANSTGVWSCTFPPPCGGLQTLPNCTPPTIPWFEYGQPYRGQPSVVYQVPFTIGTAESVATAQAYAGYGDPTGADGAVRPPDATITTDTPGSGGSRLMLIAGTSDRVRVSTRPEADAIAPGAPSAMTAVDLDTSGNATVQFVAPGDDGQAGAVSGYDIRVRANDEMTTVNFGDSMPVTSTVAPGTGASCGVEGGYPPAGTLETISVSGLLPQTDYWVGVRAFDKCHNAGELAIVHFTTPDRQAGEVSACFVATAAYGTAMANEIDMLRRFRDTLLGSSAIGELAVETYYTFSPPVAGMIGESDLLREAARDLLAPIVRRVRGLAF